MEPVAPFADNVHGPVEELKLGGYDPSRIPASIVQEERKKQAEREHFVLDKAQPADWRKGFETEEVADISHREIDELLASKFEDEEDKKGDDWGNSKSYA